MVAIRTLLTTLSLLVAASASPTPAATASKSPQKFRIHILDPDSNLKLTNYYLQAFHTGAGLADPVFVPTTSSATTAFLNGTNLQFDVGQKDEYPFSLFVSTGDKNYARWEPTSISTGYGSGNFVNNGPDGIQLKDDPEFGGWVVCRWYHAGQTKGEENLPQLFVAIQGFSGNPGKGSPPNLPTNCANVLLFPEFL